MSRHTAHVRDDLSSSISFSRASWLPRRGIEGRFSAFWGSEKRINTSFTLDQKEREQKTHEERQKNRGSSCALEKRNPLKMFDFLVGHMM